MSGKIQNNSVVKSISELYLQSEIADVYFAFENDGQTVKVPAHKTILAASNPVFRAMFYGPMKENEVIDIVDTDADAFEEFLQFFYLSEVTLTIQNIEAVVRLADKYNILDCVNTCATFLENQLVKNNIIWGFQLAITLNNQKLKEVCENEFQYADSEIFESSEFLQCDREVLKSILLIEALCCNEAELFDACIAWAKSSCQANALDENQPENLKNQLGDCLHLIQFGQMKDEEIGGIMSDELYKRLLTSDEMAEIFCMRSINNFQPKIFKCIQRLTPSIFNNENVLTCSLWESHGEKYKVKHRESLWFSTSKPVLLNGIVCAYVCNGSSEMIICRRCTEICNINVIEYYEQTVPPNSAGKDLYVGTVNIRGEFRERNLSMAGPIIIKPKNMYEIRLEHNSYGLSHTNIWKSKVDLGEGVTIDFHRNPMIIGSLQGGLVSQLMINQISKQK